MKPFEWFGLVWFGLTVKRFSKYGDLSQKLRPVLNDEAQGMDEWLEQWYQSKQ